MLREHCTPTGRHGVFTVLDFELAGYGYGRAYAPLNILYAHTNTSNTEKGTRKREVFSL